MFDRTIYREASLRIIDKLKNVYKIYINYKSSSISI